MCRSVAVLRGKEYRKIDGICNFCETGDCFSSYTARVYQVSILSRSGDQVTFGERIRQVSREIISSIKYRFKFAVRNWFNILDVHLKATIKIVFNLLVSDVQYAFCSVVISMSIS